MRVQPRSSRTSPDTEALELLQQLIETPPAPRQGWHAPVALRSAEEQRRHALSGYLLRTWVDGLLHHSERLLALAALLVFGVWVADGPVRDWLYQQQAPRTASTALAASQPAPVIPDAAPMIATERIDSAPLPFTTPGMSSAPADGDFIAPRSAAPAAVVAVAPQPSRLQIPSISLDTSVREVFVIDGAWEVADYAAGYMHGTSLPGEPGTLALAGHAGLRGAVFRDLGLLGPGDDVLLDAAGWRYRYRVRESFSVWPTDTTVLAPASSPTLVLITCTNWDTQRLIVRADLIESKPISGT